MDDDSDERSDQVRNALLKALAVVAGIAVLIALGTTVMVRALGLDESDSPGPLSGSSSDQTKPLPTTALPVPGEKTETPDPSTSPSASPDGATGDIELRVSPLMARPMERVNFTGSYKGADNAGAAGAALRHGQVERLRGHRDGEASAPSRPTS